MRARAYREQIAQQAEAVAVAEVHLAVRLVELGPRAVRAHHATGVDTTGAHPHAPAGHAALELLARHLWVVDTLGQATDFNDGAL